MFVRILGLTAAVVALSSSLANAHGAHSSNPAETDWATRHMQEEHHIDNFDAVSFFTLHDYDASGAWTPDEIRKTYGLADRSTVDVSEDRKQQVVREVLSLFDPSNTGTVTREDWTKLSAAGVRLPDFGLGPGHHGDLEYEYEIHHFEQYHGEDAKEEDLTHPEDVEHFKMHDEEDAVLAGLEKNEKLRVIERNIPRKFLKVQ